LSRRGESNSLIHRSRRRMLKTLVTSRFADSAGLEPTPSPPYGSHSTIDDFRLIKLSFLLQSVRESNPFPWGDDPVFITYIPTNCIYFLLSHIILNKGTTFFSYYQILHKKKSVSFLRLTDFIL